MTPAKRIEQIIEQQCALFELTPKDILTPGGRGSRIRGRRGNKRICAARRHAIAAVHREFPFISTVRLGQIFNRDHSTIANSLGRMGMRRLKNRFDPLSRALDVLHNGGSAYAQSQME